MIDTHDRIVCKTCVTMIKKLQFLFYMTPSQWYDNYNCYNTTNNNCVNNSYNSKKDDLWSNDELEIINGFYHTAQRAKIHTNTLTYNTLFIDNNSSIEQLIEYVRFDCIYLLAVVLIFLYCCIWSWCSVLFLLFICFIHRTLHVVLMNELKWILMKIKHSIVNALFFHSKSFCWLAKRDFMQIISLVVNNGDINNKNKQMTIKTLILCWWSSRFQIWFEF